MSDIDIAAADSLKRLTPNGRLEKRHGAIRAKLNLTQRFTEGVIRKSASAAAFKSV